MIFKSKLLKLRSVYAKINLNMAEKGMDFYEG